MFMFWSRRTWEQGYVGYKKVGTACSWLLAAVGELLAYKRGLKNTVGTYYGSKDRRFIGH